MIRALLLSIVAWAAITRPAAAEEPAPVRLAVKPLLCVIDRAATSCMMTFDIRWKSVREQEYCVHDSAREGPLHCWARGSSGQLARQREVSEEFAFWLAAPDSADRLDEVKITVLRVGSTDRRRERRTRHVWDVL